MYGKLPPLCEPTDYPPVILDAAIGAAQAATLFVYLSPPANGTEVFSSRRSSWNPFVCPVFNCNVEGAHLKYRRREDSQFYQM
jgi:hypothetical protein